MPAQRGEGAVHREHPVGDDHPATGVRPPPELRLEVGQVAVAVAVAARLAQPDAVDQRGVVQLVGDDRVPLVEEHLEHAAVGVEAGREQDRVLRAEELAEVPLQLGVQGLGPADEPHRRHPEAPLVQRVLGRGEHRRVVGEAQVVVGAEVQDRPGRRRRVRPTAPWSTAVRSCRGPPPGSRRGWRSARRAGRTWAAAYAGVRRARGRPGPVDGLSGGAARMAG